MSRMDFETPRAGNAGDPRAQLLSSAAAGATVGEALTMGLVMADSAWPAVVEPGERRTAADS
jgi:hypothetical protein